MMVVINNVRSAHNVGSIFRTTDALGDSEISLCGYTPAPLGKFCMPCKPLVKVSLGAEHTVRWEKFRSIGMCIKKLRSTGYKIYALETGNRSVPYFRFKFTSLELANIALIVGNERRGLSKSVLDKVDGIVSIPMHGSKESLNVAIAFSIAAFGWRDCSGVPLDLKS